MLMNARDMNHVSWWAFRHPFRVALIVGLAAGLLAVRLHYSLRFAVAQGSFAVMVILVLWWPRRGVLSRRVQTWLDDDDPRVLKPSDQDPG